MDLSNNKIQNLEVNIFLGLGNLIKLFLNNNNLLELNMDILKDLKSLKHLYLHKQNDNFRIINFNSIIDFFNNLSFFDNITINKNDVLKLEYCEILEKHKLQDVVIFKSNNFEKEEFSFCIRNNFLCSFKLKKKLIKYDLQEGFEWKNINNNVTCLIGLNMAGKTSILKLIEESVNSYISENNNFRCIYSNSQTITQYEDELFQDKFNENIKKIIAKYSTISKCSHVTA